MKTERNPCPTCGAHPESSQGIDYKALYEELLYAVGNKYEGETRHQTALRYIQRAERGAPPARAEWSHAQCPRSDGPEA